MTDAEYEEQKSRIIALAQRWIKPIGLGWWNIHLRYRREQGRSHGAGDEFETFAVCESDWRYGIATITVYLAGVGEHDDDDLEFMFVHELMHIFLSEMRVTDSDEATHQKAHEERVATTLAKGFVWMRDAIREEMKQPES